MTYEERYQQTTEKRQVEYKRLQKLDKKALVRQCGYAMRIHGCDERMPKSDLIYAILDATIPFPRR